MQLADQDGPVADDMGDVLHETRSPSPAELDAWARARHRRDRASGSRQTDGRTERKRGWSRVGQELAIWRENGDPGTC